MEYLAELSMDSFKETLSSSVNLAAISDPKNEPYKAPKAVIINFPVPAPNCAPTNPPKVAVISCPKVIYY